ncbi:MAG: 30S ribosomal protein S17 [Spirochaetaceae bacterium]|jgi:small subunit ribosomal protein S17|nr:30S ribosomal protein S17 [Spirochaetaceae bacterium]
MSETKTNKKEFTGLVVSNKMDKTIVVEITTKKPHPLYRKYVTTSVKYKAHDENNQANAGDTVRIVECRPVSKYKTWKLAEIIERAR